MAKVVASATELVGNNYRTFDYIKPMHSLHYIASVWFMPIPIQHRKVLTLFPLTLKTIITAQMLSIGENGEKARTLKTSSVPQSTTTIERLTDHVKFATHGQARDSRT